MFVYLDNSATTKPSDEAVKAALNVMTEDFGNPSSYYRLGLSAEKILKESRENVAESLGCAPEEVFFTGSGTESDNWVINEVWQAKKREGNRIITSSVEHPAVYNSCERLKAEGADVVYIRPEKDGRVNAEKIAAALTKDTILVSIMHVNNETGAVMPLSEIKKAIDASGFPILFHTDAVQSYGKLDCDVKKTGVDFLSLSGHKVHALKGTGALYIGKTAKIFPLIEGGGQERGLRSGTENMPGIASLGAAAKHIIEHRAEDFERMKALKARLLSFVIREIPGARVNSPEDSTPSVLSMGFSGCRGEVLLHMLDAMGVAVSTGSACSSHAKGNRVLSEMGLSPSEISGNLRFSFSYDNMEEEIDYAAASLKKAVEEHRRLMKLGGKNLC